MAERRRGGQESEGQDRPAREVSQAPQRQREAPVDDTTTGRFLVLLREDAVQDGIRQLTSIMGAEVARSADFSDSAMDPDTLGGAPALVLDRLGVAVVDAPPDQFQALGIAAAGEGPIEAIEPERIVEAFESTLSGGTEARGAGVPTTLPTAYDLVLAAPPAGGAAGGVGIADYLAGYRDAVVHLVERVRSVAGVTPDGAAASIALAEDAQTWGLVATGVATSRFSGRGVRVAVLDTGLDLNHPDFTGRAIVSQSFIPNQSAQDGQGHGTHCIGTAAGPLQPQVLPRYGIAYEAEIFAGKVLSDQGRGTDGGILSGIEWAIANGCTIVSMSLGARLPCAGPLPPFSRVFEIVAQRALAAGTLIIAAAGNESRRQEGRICPVGHPANCPSIAAVGALDERLQVAFFSNAGLVAAGGQVDIAAPGVNVHSSAPMPKRYQRLSGTSMATPHVAGIAALFAQAQPRARGRELLQLVMQGARRLPLPSRDVGAGLVQAPSQSQ